MNKLINSSASKSQRADTGERASVKSVVFETQMHEAIIWFGSIRFATLIKDLRLEMQRILSCMG